MSEYDREKAIHDYLVTNCVYDASYDLCHTSYGALVKGKAVCDGYTKAFQHLCREAGLQTSMVEGVAANGISGAIENHAWNIVKIDGDYYFVDVTWDDANAPGAEEKIYYMYFNTDAGTMEKDHFIGSYEFPIPDVPSCTATKANYYVKNNAVIATLNIDDIAKLAVQTGNKYVCRFLFTGEEDFAAWFNSNFVELCRKIDKKITGIEYTVAGSEYILTFSK